MGIQKSNLYKITTLTFLSLFFMLGCIAQHKKYKKKRKKHKTTQTIKTDIPYCGPTQNRIQDSLYKKNGFVLENECEVPPSFKYGDKAYQKLILDSLQIPKSIQEGEDESTRVYIQCLLDTDGTLSQIKIIDKIPKNSTIECNEEAIRFAKSTSKMWNICSDGKGKYYKCLFTFGIEFKSNAK